MRLHTDNIIEWSGVDFFSLFFSFYPGTEVGIAWCGCWEPNLGPLHKYYINLLDTEPYL